MSDVLVAPFQFEFMQRAFVAALIVGTLCSTIGTYVVLRKLAFIGDGIAHASFAGIVIAYLRGLDYYVGAAIVAVATALGIGFVNRRAKVSLDTAIGVLFTGAFALGVFLMSRLPNYNVDLQGFLFGNILAVSRADLVLILVLSALVSIVLLLLYRPLLYTSFDPVVAEASGIRVAFIDYALLVMLALTVGYFALVGLGHQLTPVTVLLEGTLFVAFGGVGVVLTLRQPRNRIGWILLGCIIVLELGGIGARYAVLAYRLGYHGLPLAAAAVVLGNSVQVLALLMIPVIILLFPDGRLPGSRWRWLLWAYAGLPAPARAALNCDYPRRPAAVAALAWAFGLGAVTRIELALSAWEAQRLRLPGTLTWCSWQP